MATAAIAHFAVSLQPQHLPATVTHAATRSLYNYIGCAIGGSQHPTTTKAIKALAPFFGSPTSTVLGHSIDSHTTTPSSPSSQPFTGRTDAQHAALFNGISSHVHDYDDTHLETIIHPSGPVASALLAVCQMPDMHISGPAFLTAFTAGVEVACKLGLAVWPDHYDIGWHITSTTGAIGAAVAVGKVLGLRESEMRHAVGVAATQVVGLREMFGSDTKSFHPGRAAQAGLLAAVLAKEGWTSSDNAIEAKRGWANVVSTRQRLDELIMKGLGRMSFAEVDGGITQSNAVEAGTGNADQYDWEIVKNAFKPFPCGIVCHPAIDACIQLREDLLAAHPDLAQDDSATTSNAALASLLTNIDLQVHPLVLELTAKRTPRNGLEGKFSVFHGCAVGLLFGRAGPAQYADDVVQDPTVIAVRDKIDATAPDAGTDGGVGADAAIVTVHLVDGKKLEKRVDHALGSLTRPMSDEQLTEKFLDQCGSVLGMEGARKASELAWGIGAIADVREVLDKL